MKTAHILLMVVLLLFCSCAAFADRTLERAEILQLFQDLTSQPKQTWLPAGTIEARHEEYRAPKITDLSELKDQTMQKMAEYQNSLDKRELTENLQKMRLDAIPFNTRYELSNESTMTSTAIVKFDGERFYWEINVDSRTDSVKPDKDLEGNFMTEQFNLDWNARRIFAWDGEKYTTYFLPGNHAVVDSTGETPHVVTGPLTAGVVPWGYGYYAYDNLAAMDSQAVEKYDDGELRIYLTLNNSDGSEMLIVMDPAKDYAVVSCSINGLGDAVISKQYSGYQLVSGKWVPATILLERYEAGSNRLLARDLWDITAIDGNAPRADSFEVEYEPEALVEYASVVTGKPAMYRNSELIDTEQLLVDRLDFAANEGSIPQNCATAALKYTVSQLGRDATAQQLAELVNQTDNSTTLYSMKQFAQQMGLFCRAVQTDIQTLKTLENCQVILHIPGKNHFVVLSDIDEDYVRIIDLAGSKFYYRTDIDFFDMDWTEGTALLISDTAIMGEFTEIDDAQLGSIIGAAGYQCNVLRQTYNVDFCTEIGGDCYGYYKVYYERWGCGAAEDGSCTQSKMVRYEKSPCIEDPYYPDNCTITGEWTAYYMAACA